MNKPAVGWPDVDHSRTPLAWSLPTNLMPPVAAGWSPGTRRNASEAESILSEAVAWWDPTVSGFRDGDRWLRNSGTAGGLLDLRLGSSVVANTNDPKWLGPEDVGYVYLPGTTSNRITVPDEAALRITGDIDVRACVALDSWTAPSDSPGLASKYGVSGNRGYTLLVNATGNLVFGWSPNGTTEISQASTAAFTFSPGHRAWVRATLDVDNGASGYDLKFYTSDNGTTWTQLGNTITGGATTSIYASTQTFETGSILTSFNKLSGRVYRAQVLNGIDGTTVLDIDCDAIITGSATSFTATTGQTVTINRSTSGRKSVAMPARRLGGRACFLFGTDDYMEVVDNWQHQLLNFGQGDSFTVLAAVRQWNTTNDLARLVNKGATTGARWSLYNNGLGYVIGSSVNDGTTGGGADAPATAAGTLGTYVGVHDRATRFSTTYSNGTAGTRVSLASIRSVRNSSPFLVGSVGGGAYCNMEFTAAAIFRRPLTAREIAVLSTYYSGG